MAFYANGFSICGSLGKSLLPFQRSIRTFILFITSFLYEEFISEIQFIDEVALPDLMAAGTSRQYRVRQQLSILWQNADVLGPEMEMLSEQKSEVVSAFLPQIVRFL